MTNNETNTTIPRTTPTICIGNSPLAIRSDLNAVRALESLNEALKAFEVVSTKWINGSESVLVATGRSLSLSLVTRIETSEQNR